MDVRVLTREDIIEIIKYLVELINSKASVDDIDHAAYSYLPRSIRAVPARAAMTRLITDAGFCDATFRSLTLGVCTMYTAKKT